MPTPKKRQLSVRIDATLLNELKTLCRDYSGRPHYLVFSEEIEQALRVRLNLIVKKTSDDRQTDPTQNSLPARSR